MSQSMLISSDAQAFALFSKGRYSVRPPAALAGGVH
jgi:hypothetical protein